MERGLILNRLLDKYEKSKHVATPNTSSRRVMLHVDKGDIPEYDYESAEVRDRFNKAAKTLLHEGIIKVERLKDRPIITSFILNLDEIDKAYQAAHRKHPAQVADEYHELIYSILSDVKTPWIVDLRDDACQSIKQTMRLPAFCKHGADYAREFLNMLAFYDGLGDATITMRAFSTACFQNSKRFEQEFQDEFLRAALRFHPEIAEISAQDEIGAREKLALLGIYSHPELYQLSGQCTITTQSGKVDISPFFPHGIGLSGTCIDEIVSFDLQFIRKIIFIENLTNYNEYLRTEISPDVLVVFHGGFLSPKKRQMLQLLSESVDDSIDVLFWADIDLGGFRMFSRLQKLFPQLSPMRMSATDVAQYAQLGLARDKPYIDLLHTALERHEFPVFEDSIQMILKHGVTIEQEVFLHRKNI